MKKNYSTFFISLLFSLIVYVFLHGYYELYYSLILAVFSSALFIFYASKRIYFYVSFAVVASFLFLDFLPFIFKIQILSASLLVQSILIKGLSSKDHILKRNIEIRRDILQIFIGILFILSLSFLKLSVVLVLLGIFSAYLMFFYAKKAKRIHRLMERDGVIFGSGALFMAVGALFLIGFVNNFNFLFLGMFALLLSDPIATISGLNFSNKLGRKSFIGSAAFFVSLLIPGFLLFGLLGLIFALVFMLAERFSPIDDNLFIPITAVLLFAIV